MNWIVPATITFLCWGVWSFFPKLTTQYISPISALVYESVGATIIGIIVIFFLGFKLQFNIKGALLGITTGILGTSGALGFLFAVTSGKVAIVSTFVSMSPILTIVLAYLIVKEPISSKEKIGIASAFVALFCFSFKF